MGLTTKLEAVNIMISVIGESPVNTLGGTSVPVTVIQSVQVLDETNKAIQSEGWHFNTEYDYPLIPDALRDEIEAKARAIDSDSESADRTIFDNYSVLRVLDR